MHLLIKPETIHSERAYLEHSSYHEGDSGLDLFFNEEVNIPAGETKLISLDIKCEAGRRGGGGGEREASL